MSSAAGDAARPPLLHGNLHLTIHGARNLPNMDLLSTLLRRACPCLSPDARPRSRSPSNDDDQKLLPHIPTSDPYASVVVSGATLARTRVVRNSEYPEWNERFVLPLAHFATRVEFHVKDSDPFGSDLIGIAALSAADLLASRKIDSHWVDIFRPDGRGAPKPDAAIRISATFTPAAPSRLGDVPAYFPQRHGCSVRLYQDAHVLPGSAETVVLDGGKVFDAGRCWEDMCMAVLGAHHLVYVVGWSVKTDVKLVRKELSPEMEEKAAAVMALAGHSVEDMTLGELLKYKSEEGVRVCLLVWDDKTSHDTFFLRSGGMMQTHDELTKKYFKHSSVICVLSPRYPSSKLSMVKQKVVGTLYTHHQKCLLVDTPASDNTRKITAFLGGLDLCDGRYDTPSHRLFDGLDTVFKKDFHNPTFPAEAEKGPRQPWHDLHCRLEGPAAYDVLMNFEQRWRKATKLRELFKKKVSHWRDDSLLKLERISWMLSPRRPFPEDDPRLQVLPESDVECWHAQVFRSIDTGSVPSPKKDSESVFSQKQDSGSVPPPKKRPGWVQGFPTCDDAPKMNLMCDKNVVVDQSIHMAYVKAIRAAQHFIYIENQYFIGSSYAWPSDKHRGGAANRVPMEIALKVASKIRAGEKFAVYIVIPMWPEGNPNSAPVQEILYWQSQTMETMYRVIADAIKDTGLMNKHPQDYLNFYCLGNREVVPRDHGQSSDQSDSRSPAALARKNRRFMIYVHSKGMIVDDEYVILGSANINQRSLEGSRDTEIAVGSYQPHHTWSSKNRHPRGQVYGYRMSLWAEHLGSKDARFEQPESEECVRRVNEIADKNWASYTDTKVTTPLQGHLIRYPVRVGGDGKVEALPEHDYFPDVGGKVLGSANNLPDNLTM